MSVMLNISLLVHVSNAKKDLVPQGVFDVIPAKAGIQGIYLIAFWIAQKLHCVSRPLPSKGQARGNDNYFFNRNALTPILLRM